MDLVALSNLPWDTYFPEGAGPPLDRSSRTHAGSAGEIEAWLAAAARRSIEGEGPGGAPTNVALAFAGLGGRATVVGPVAADRFGNRLRVELPRLGVDLAEIAPAPPRQPHSLAFASGGGERLFLASFPEFPGPVASPFTAWAGPGWLVTSAYELHHPSFRDFILDGFAKARAGGRSLVFDLADPNFVMRERAAIDRLVGLGLELMVGGPEALASLLECDPARLDPGRMAGLARTVLVTQGPGGVRTLSGGRDLHLEAEPVTPVDTTGAGDAFLGAFLAARSRRLGVVDSARFALTAARQSIGVIGAHLPVETWRRLGERLHAWGPPAAES